MEQQPLNIQEINNPQYPNFKQIMKECATAKYKIECEGETELDIKSKYLDTLKKLAAGTIAIAEDGEGDHTYAIYKDFSNDICC